MDFCQVFLVEGYGHGALRQDLRITPFEEHFKTCTFWKVLLMNFASIWNNLLKHWISVDFFLAEGYGQGTLRKDLRIAPFVEHFDIATLRKSC